MNSLKEKAKDTDNIKKSLHYSEKVLIFSFYLTQVGSQAYERSEDEDCRGPGFIQGKSFSG